MEIFIGIFALIFLGIIIGITFNIAWLAFGLVAYFVPTIIAAYRKHPQTLWIFLINLFFGWSVAGWIIPLLWAFDFDKVVMDFIEYRKAKSSKDTIIEGEVVKEETSKEV